MLQRRQAFVVDGDVVTASRQRLGEADDGRFGAAEGRCLGETPVEDDAVIDDRDPRHRYPP